MLNDPSGWPAWYLAVLLAFSVFLGGLAVYDARRRRIPNGAVYPALLVAGALAFVAPTGPWWSFLLAGLLAGGALALLAVITRGGMGYGDAKLAALVGLLTGWPGVLAALFVAVGSGAAAGLTLTALGRIGRREAIPFAPSLALGGLVGLVAGQPLAHLLWPGLA